MASTWRRLVRSGLCALRAIVRRASKSGIIPGELDLDRAGDLMHARFLPMGPRLQPEDGGSDRLRAFGGRTPVEELGYPRSCLGGAGVQLRPVVPAQGLRIDSDNAGDVGLRDAVGGHCLDLSPP